MNEIVNKFLLAGDKNNLVLLIVFVVHSLKARKELKNLWRLEIQTLLTKLSLIKLAFNMI